MGLVDHLVGRDLVGTDLDVRGEGLDRQPRSRFRTRRRRGHGSWRLGRWPRARVERAGQPIEEFPPGRREIALGGVVSREIALRSVLGDIRSGAIALRSRLDLWRAGGGRCGWGRRPGDLARAGRSLFGRAQEVGHFPRSPSRRSVDRGA